MLDQKIFINQTTEQLFSTVTKLSPQLEVETVFDGRENARYMRLYLDGDNPGTYGPNRPCLRVGFLPDGKTIDTVSLFNDPNGVELNWRRS